MAPPTVNAPNPRKNPAAVALMGRGYRSIVSYLGIVGAVLALLAFGYAVPAGSGAGATLQEPDPEHPRGLPPRDERFAVIGSAECRSCHRGVYQQWMGRTHAAATDPLTANERFDASCQVCHEPAFDDFQRGVGCESCHGPGSAYADLDVMVDPLKRAAAGLWKPEDTCAYCHNPGHPFHVERDLEAEAKLIHGTLDSGWPARGAPR